MGVSEILKFETPAESRSNGHRPASSRLSSLADAGVQGSPKIRPNFIIAGASKAGTTSLYEYLKQHPEIFMPSNPKHKEPHYFVHCTGFTDLDAYLDLFQDGWNRKAIGEATGSYLFSEESPAWIKSVLGSIKIIIVLRNPAKRAFSLYTMMVRDGYEDAKTFEEALAREPSRLLDRHFRELHFGYFHNYLYFNTGLYFQQVKRYIDTFGRKNVKICLFEDMAKDPLAVCKDIFEFLDVDSQFIPVFEVYNESCYPRSLALQCWLRGLFMGHQVWYPAGIRYPLGLIPRQYRAKLFRKVMELNKRFGTKSEIPRGSYEELMKRYASDIAQLEALIGSDLSAWYAKQPRS